ncbi:serine/threonine protein kinase [Sphingobacterium lactis]|uniref:serine/threonine protein kinase n=1 Tax=Sphingobacterium lactis TaxID=797291 RepID=UPI003EC5DB99
METKQQHSTNTAQAPLGAGRFRSYAPLLEKFGIPFTLRKPWLLVGKAEYYDRWNICLSVCIKDAEAIFKSVLPILKERKAAFSMIADQLQHNRINNHAFPTPLFGKTLQIFTDSPDIALGLATELAKATEQFSGIVIPGAVRLGSIVYATFSVRNPEFNAGDPNSLPFRFATNHQPSPFPPTMIWKEKQPRRFLKKRYLPIKLIRSSPKGNILKGLDLYQLKWVFIKQANAWASEDFQGREMRDRLLWQQEVANAISEWVRTPKVMDFMDQDGLSYLITEYMEGTTLESLILSWDSSDKRLQQLLTYYQETLVFVDNLHKLGYVHRDLTAKNILIHDDHVYLTDFELAHRLDDTTTAPYVSGTIGYMSPEQQRSMQPTVQEDIYTLGALLYYIISGENPKALVPYDGLQLEERLLRIDAPEPLKTAVGKCMARMPEDRWTLEQLIGAVDPLLPSPKEQKKTQRRKSWQQIKRKLAYSGILALLAAITVIALWLASDEPNSRNNGFKRVYIHGNLAPFLELTIPEDVRYLAGRRGDSLYFSTLTAGEIFIVHQPTGRTKRRFLIADAALRSRLHGSNMVEANRFGLTLYDGNNRMIVEEKDDGTLHEHHVPELFTRAVRISQNAVALRKFKPGERDQYLYRFDLIQDTALDESRVTDRVNDGGLITGGMLDFDTDNGHGVYVTRYANRITLLDTSMRILATGNTVGTFSNYTLKSQTVTRAGGAKITNAGPAYYVNKAVAIHDGHLYVNSYVKADNETAEQFRDSNVIDIYRMNPLEPQRYLGSLRLPTEKKDRVRNFRIYDNTLTVLTPRKLRLYHIPVTTTKPTSSES